MHIWPINVHCIRDPEDIAWAGGAAICLKLVSFKYMHIWPINGPKSIKFGINLSIYFG